MIRIVNMEKSYDENITPLKDINTVINEGDVIVIIGPSGCGKSTLIRCINLLEKPTKGQIFLDDTEITDPSADITKVRQRIGMVFQQFNLFSHLTVAENIMFAPVNILHKDSKTAYDEAMVLLRRVGLAEKALSYPDELSGGQQQRVAIARTLAMDPEVILFDEPTSALDPSMVGEVESVIYDLKAEGKTMMIVTHDMNFAYNIA
ncbi:MAG: amino acid ABC transporter ATP-binding protein, partial [Firmicutes bacterium]|nr:amino acid ABC transporter ATP-binding protein [Bacillota bacterium]